MKILVCLCSYVSLPWPSATLHYYVNVNNNYFFLRNCAISHTFVIQSGSLHELFKNSFSCVEFNKVLRQSQICLPCFGCFNFLSQNVDPEQFCPAYYIVVFQRTSTPVSTADVFDTFRINWLCSCQIVSLEWPELFSLKQMIFRMHSICSPFEDFVNKIMKRQSYIAPENHAPGLKICCIQVH